MANGASQVGHAQHMTLTVAQVLDRIRASMQQYREHLQQRRAALLALLKDSHQSDVSHMIAVLDEAIERLTNAIVQIIDGATRARGIEARL